MLNVRACGYCGKFDHHDRWDKNDRAVCPKRRADMARWKRQETRARRKAGIPDGPCDFCGKEPKQVKIIQRGIDDRWAGRECAAMLEQLSRVLGGNPKRMPLMTTVRGGKG